MRWERGLLVKQPWVDLIVDGKKTWELRSRATKIRGHFALIQSKSGLIIGGADLIDCMALNDRMVKEYQDRHQVNPEKSDNYGFPLFAWVLANAYRLPEPVPYKHPQGAVIWVKFDETMHQM